MGSFAFGIRGSETYYRWTGRVNGVMNYDSVQCTKEEYDAQEAGTSREDGLKIWAKLENMELQKVDELICDFLGEPAPSVKLDSQGYYLCHELGYAALYKLGGSVVEQRHVDHILMRLQEIFDSLSDETKSKEGWTEGRMERYRAMIRWVFLEKFEFSGWA